MKAKKRRVSMSIKFIAHCLHVEQARACKSLGIAVMHTCDYARSIGEVMAGSVTDFSLHCFNSETVRLLQKLGASRVTLHPELNLAQMRDIKKPIDTEAVIYGKVPLMQLGVPIMAGALVDRKKTNFFVHEDIVYNSVPLFMADYVNDIIKAGITYGRLIFTTETVKEVNDVIDAYLRRKALIINFTRGKFFSRV